MKAHKTHADQLPDLGAGCSALSWTTADGLHLFGRNFDFNRIAGQTRITYVPRDTAYHTYLEDEDFTKEGKHHAAYATLGTGLLLSPSVPILYEGINEKGLMGAQLYYRGFAHFDKQAKPGTHPLQPPFLVYHLLAQCASVEEAADLLCTQYSLVARPLLGSVPPLHWTFTDRSGETMVIEPDKDGLHIHRKTMGVMTNSPNYAWHRLNLLNYAGIQDADYDTLELNGDKLEQYFSGSGAQGLPGDWSSPSRFIRLAFLRQYAEKGQNEEEGIAYLMHLMQSVAFPLGMVRVTQPGHITKHDTGVVPYDYTIYTSSMCAESLRFYWVTYENQQVQCASLRDLIQNPHVVQFSLKHTPNFYYLTKGSISTSL